MSDTFRRFIAASAAFFAGLACMSTPIVAYADSIENYDFAEDFLNDYKSQGTDEDGNVILSEDDYESYMNDVLAYIEKNSAEVSDSETLTKSQTRALDSSAAVKASSSSDLILDEVKEKSRFLDLPIFDNFVVDAIKWMITECLSNPIHAGEVLPEDTETETETESETEAETTPPTTTTDVIPGIAGLASNLQKYTINGNDLYERIDISFNAKISGLVSTDDAKATVTRSGLGATASYDMTYDADKQSRKINLTWGSGSYTNATIGFPAGTMWAGYTLDIYRLEYTNDNNVASSSSFQPRVYNFSVNQLPVISRSGSTTVSLASILTGSNAVFAENSFYSNHPTYISNHTINSSTNNYWNSYNVSNNTNSYISSSTTINTTNYNDYSQYGYYVDNSGSLAIDEASLNAYIQNTLLAALLQGYVDFYTNFPEVGVNVTDEDITYVNPFDDGEDPTEPDTGTPSVVIDYDEILSEGELESILTQETYNIPELDTSFALETFYIDYEGITETTTAALEQMRKRGNSKNVDPDRAMYSQLRADIQDKGDDLVTSVQYDITYFVQKWFTGYTVDFGDGPFDVTPAADLVVHWNPIYRVIMCTAIFGAIYKALKR